MSFFKKLKDRMTAPKAGVSLKLNKDSYVLGENVEGTLAISADEDFSAKEIRCELQCSEEAKHLRRVYDENFRGYVEREVRDSAVLFGSKPNVSGPMKINKGYAGSFPFKANLPAGGRPTFQSIDQKVTWSIKGVIAVDDRPDVTSNVAQIQVLPPSASPVIREREVIKEVVMIPCKYCGGLMSQTETACPHCGAKRTL
jgi:sporulation-control protein spo0M